jgi:hypothetical protein
MVALTAVLQAGDRLATLLCRHCNASLPPGVTLEHFDMKSLRHAPRMALCCSGVTWAVAVVEKAASASATASERNRRFDSGIVPPMDVWPHSARRRFAKPATKFWV